MVRRLPPVLGGSKCSLPSVRWSGAGLLRNVPFVEFHILPGEPRAPAGAALPNEYTSGSTARR